MVDRPDLCDFTTPSLLERDPVLIAVGTGGASAGLAKQLRLRLEALLPANLGRLAAKLSQMRGAIKQRWPKMADRRQALDAALTSGGALDLLSDDAADKVEAWLDDGGETSMKGRVELKLASGDPDDLTLRQARLLGSADYVIHDVSVPQAILNRARADAVRLAMPLEGPEPNGLVVVVRM